MFWNKENDKELVEHIKANGFCTRRNLCLKFNQNQYQMQKIITRLEDEGKLTEEMIGIERVIRCIKNVSDVAK